ncbi:unnamed protein product [Gadus morhua 'NCC']
MGRHVISPPSGLMENKHLGSETHGGKRSPAPTLGVFRPPAARPGSDSSALMEGPLLWAAAGTSGAHCVVLSVDGATALHATVSYLADKIGETAASPPARPRHLYPASADYIFSR